jgi:hypothetical protein
METQSGPEFLSVIMNPAEPLSLLTEYLPHAAETELKKAVYQGRLGDA